MSYLENFWLCKWGGTSKNDFSERGSWQESCPTWFRLQHRIPHRIVFISVLMRSHLYVCLCVCACARFFKFEITKYTTIELRWFNLYHACSTIDVICNLYHKYSLSHLCCSSSMCKEKIGTPTLRGMGDFQVVLVSIWVVYKLESIFGVKIYRSIDLVQNALLPVVSPVFLRFFLFFCYLVPINCNSHNFVYQTVLVMSKLTWPPLPPPLLPHQSNISCRRLKSPE